MERKAVFNYSLSSNLNRRIKLEFEKHRSAELIQCLCVPFWNYGAASTSKVFIVLVEFHFHIEHNSRCRVGTFISSFQLRVQLPLSELYSRHHLSFRQKGSLNCDMAVRTSEWRSESRWWTTQTAIGSTYSIIWNMELDKADRGKPTTEVISHHETSW